MLSEAGLHIFSQRILHHLGVWLVSTAPECDFYAPYKYFFQMSVTDTWFSEGCTAVWSQSMKFCLRCARRNLCTFTEKQDHQCYCRFDFTKPLQDLVRVESHLTTKTSLAAQLKCKSKHTCTHTCQYSYLVGTSN